jgi:hypothetical protein
MTEKTLSKAAIQKEREALQKRLADLDAAERVLEGWALPRLVEEPESAAEALGLMPSIKQIILREAAKPAGTTAQEAAAVISAYKQEDYPATNVSPKLSLYGSHKLLKLYNGRWFLTAEGKEELELSKD